LFRYDEERYPGIGSFFEVTLLVFSFRAALALLVCAGLVASPAWATTSGSVAGTSAHRSHRLTTHRKAHRVVRGQQSIDPERATQIQQALIREHYLSGDPTGKWDAGTIAAMQKYQADQGWQTKLMPDSRAIKKLGLGPDYSNALNAKNSDFSSAPPANNAPSLQTAGFASASGVNQ
jgi:peptidoglycan hydrolase-like protein with peptidoglycan-binding domain